MIKNYYLFLELILVLALVNIQSWGQPAYKLEEALKNPTKATKLWIDGPVIIPQEIKTLKRLKEVHIARRSSSLGFPKALLTLDSLQVLTFFLWGGKTFKVPRELVQMKHLKEIRFSSPDALDIEYPREIKQRKDLVIKDDNRFTHLRLVTGYQQGIWPVLELGLSMRRTLPFIFTGNPMTPQTQWNPAFWSWSVVWEKYLTRNMEGYRFMFGNSLIQLGSIYYRTPGEKQSGFMAYRVELGINSGHLDLSLGYNIAPGHQEVNSLLLNFRLKFPLLVFKKYKYY